MLAGAAAKGNLPRVALLTDNFTFEAPLSDRVREAIAAAFDQGWADPKKLSQASHRALSLRTSAVEEFAAQLQVSPGVIEVTSEPQLLHHFSLPGFLTPESTLYTSTVDLGKIRAVARAHRGTSLPMEVAINGAIALPENLTSGDVVSLQVENGETGIHQNLEPWRSLPARVVLDATRSIPSVGLSDGFSAATFDAQSWNGPSSLGFLIINEDEIYRYPLAHIAPIRVPGSYSLPLLVGATIALHEYLEVKNQIEELRNFLAHQLRTVSGLTVIGSAEPSRYLSAIVDGFSGEEVLRALLQVGISIDSGSACSPEDLAPSHVIGALGLPTTGHLRFTIHPGMIQGDIEKLVTQVEKTLQSLRS